MMAVSLFSARFLFSPQTIQRHLMTTAQKAEKALEKLKSNSYYEKYAEKIAKIQQTSPEDFLAKVSDLEKKYTKKETTQLTEGKFSQLLKPKQPLQINETTKQSLDKVMKIDLIQDKTTDEIQTIWQEYHRDKHYISAVIPAEDYAKLEENSRKFPVFLFPLPREQGYEFIMCQFDNDVVHFTPLLYYQVHKENAPECLTLTHYTELRDKDIVLMRGEYDRNVVDLKEAQCLANQLQLYYVMPSAAKLKLLETFTAKPDEFKHASLIAEIENLSL